MEEARREDEDDDNDGGGCSSLSAMLEGGRQATPSSGTQPNQSKREIERKHKGVCLCIVVVLRERVMDSRTSKPRQT